MNHRGTLDPHTDGRPGRRRRENAQPAEGGQSFNAFGAPGDSRSRRRPLNTAAASAAADAHRTAADDFWSTNQGWADSQADNWSEADRQPQNTWQQDEWQQGGWQQDEKPAWHSDPNWNTQQGWTEAQSWSEAPAQTWSATPAQSWHDAEPAVREHEEPARNDRPTTIAEALESAPVAEEDTEEPRQSRSRGAHRVAAPPSALKGRAAVVAVAAGAVVAAGQCATAEPSDHKQAQQATDYEAAGSVHEIAAQSMATEDPAAANTASPQMLGGNLPVDTGRFGEMLANGAQFAEDLAQAEEAKFRPLFSRFASGSYTSGFGARWGVQHLGIDVAAPIGTPIYAVADGEVIDAGPASGFGMWVRLLHADGTITVYGHVDTTTVSMGEYVFAGDQIATVGNRGFSTGPHCHFEVWLNGGDKVDPVPWLATRGISLTGNGD